MGNLFTYKCLIRRDLANTYTHTHHLPSQKKDIFILYILSEQKIFLYLLNSTVDSRQRSFICTTRCLLLITSIQKLCQKSFCLFLNQLELLYEIF
jgi:hypothetical protein